MRVVLTGGGTGGHIYPAVSISQALRDADTGVELLFVGSSHGPEGAIAQEAGIPFRAVPSSPLTKAVSFRNLASLLKLAAGVPRARGILKAFKPDVVIGTGGYTTAAVLLAAKSLGCKVVIHEQNAVPGRTNVWLSKLVDKVCVSVESSVAFFPKSKTVVTGMPVRKDFVLLPSKQEARKALGMAEDFFTILVVGGSQGAKALNELMLGAWPVIDDGKTQVIHQAGKRNIDEMKSMSIPNAGRYRVEAYFEMLQEIASADLFIGRCGASTIAEITAAGLPSIMVPYPFAQADHQTKNAEFLVERGAAILCKQSEVTAESLASVIIELRASAEELGAMAKASKSVAKVDAASRVAEVAKALVK